MQNALSSLLLAILTGALLLGGCDLQGSEGEEESTVDSTYVQATLNGKEMWSGRPLAGFSKQGRINPWLDVVGRLYDERFDPPILLEELTLAVPFRGVGSYSLVPKEYDLGNGWTRISLGAFAELDHDATLADYTATNDTSANHLTITRFDSTAMVMEGTFRTTVVVDSADREDEPGEPPRRPDTLRFTDGEFCVKVKEVPEGQ